MPSLADSMRNILEGTFDLVAGASVQYVDENGGVHSDLPGILYDEATRFRRDKLVVNDMGVLDGNTKRLVLKQSTIRARGIDLSIAGYFMIDGERWDFASNEPAMQKNLTPFAGITDMFILMYLRRAEEINNTTNSGNFGVSGWENT